ncbi:MAG: iron-sulfur cluster assembly scaffold protein [Rhodobacteraceae bacterium]|nr:iron-sulfur cluster assembly scaffold protein [Paracoccaceae bacterium]
MADTDLIKLYSQQILALAADIPHSERLQSPQASVMKRSPLCGSTVTIDVDVAQGRVSRLGMDVKACALGQASAAILGGEALGKTPAELAAARDQLKALLKEEGEPPREAFAQMKVLTPARDYKNRHASILLAWEAITEAAAEAEAYERAGAAEAVQ